MRYWLKIQVKMFSLLSFALDVKKASEVRNTCMIGAFFTFKFGKRGKNAFCGQFCSFSLSA